MWVNPFDVLREIITSPFATLIYVVLGFGIGLVIGKWLGSWS